MKEKYEDPRRKFLVDALSIGLFTGVSLTGVWQQSYAMGALKSKLPPGRSIYKLSGDVRIDGQAANIDSVIGANSLIQTGRKGKIIFVVGTDAFVMRRNSTLQLGGEGILIQGMRILSGKLLSVFGKREAQPTITTSTATIGIRGTGIYIESDPDKSYVCTCYGHVKISANADPNVSKEIVTKHHDQPLFILPSPGKGDNLIIPAPVYNHTGAELDLLERLVGRRVPFSRVNVDRGGGGGGRGY